MKSVFDLRLRLVFAVLLLGWAIKPDSAFGFTQGAKGSGAVVPMGHEWITRLAAIELLGGDQVLKPDPADPRNKWPPEARAGHTSLVGAEAERDRIMKQLLPRNDGMYAATYKAVFDAILGERWVDMGGSNFVADKWTYTRNCLDLVAQEPPEIQYDHFMRKPSDIDAAGGVTAAKASGQRFVDYFIAAAMAKDGEMRIWDGGGYAEEFMVDRHYFLFGRALHLFEDSFSPDHTVRIPADYFRKVRQVKSYLCAHGSEQHSHLSPPKSDFYKTGDVIWVSMSKDSTTWAAYMPSNMRAPALAATEGSKDAWAAFIRTMAQPREKREAYARSEATQLAAAWLGFDAKDMTAWYQDAAHRETATYYVRSTNKADDGGNGTTQQECMDRDWKGATQAAKLAELRDGQRTCLYNMIPAWTLDNQSKQPQPDFDSSLQLAYYWKWRNDIKFETPPKNWDIGQKTLTFSVKLYNRLNNQALRQEKGYLYNDPPDTRWKAARIVQWSLVRNPDVPDQDVFQVKGQDEYLNKAWSQMGFSEYPSIMGIYKTPNNGGHFSLSRRKDGYYEIENTDYMRRMYMSCDAKTYADSSAPIDSRSHWRIEGLPEPFLADGSYSVRTLDAPGGPARNLQTGEVEVGGPGVGYGLDIERQPDGRYLLKMPGGFSIREDPKTHRLVADKGAGGLFSLVAQSDERVLIKGDNDAYWWADSTAGSPIRTDPSTVPLQECGKENQGKCHVPMVFEFERAWDASRFKEVCK
jgi:hypothetical protein